MSEDQQTPNSRRQQKNKSRKSESKALGQIQPSITQDIQQQLSRINPGINSVRSYSYKNRKRSPRKEDTSKVDDSILNETADAPIMRTKSLNKGLDSSSSSFIETDGTLDKHLNDKARPQNANELILKLCLAVIANKHKFYNKYVSQINQYYQLEHLNGVLELQLDDLRLGSRTSRIFFSAGLIAAIELKDVRSTRMIERFAKQYIIQLTIDRKTIQICTDRKDFRLIESLILNQVYIKIPVTQPGKETIYREKFVQLSDFVNEIRRERVDSSKIVDLMADVEFYEECIEALDMDDILPYLIKDESTSSAKLIIVLNNQNMDQSTKERISKSAFRVLLQLESYSLAFMTYNISNSILVEDSGNSIEAIIQGFKNSPNGLEFKLFLFDNFIPYLNYKQVNTILGAIEDQLGNEPLKSIFVTNVNPYYSSLKLIYLLKKVQSSFPLTSLRIDQISSIIEEKLIPIAEAQTQFSILVEDQMTLTNGDHKDSFYYTAKLDQFGLLSSKVMDRILRNSWKSKYDISGDIMDNATSYSILKIFFIDQGRDYESSHRFYQQRDRSKMNPHRLIFKVYLNQMETRYLIELLIFFTVTVFFLVNLLEFNASLLDQNNAAIEFLSLGLFITNQEELDAQPEHVIEIIDGMLVTAAAGAQYNNAALELGFIMFWLPINHLVQQIYARWSGKPRFIRTSIVLIDAIIFCSCVLWLYKFETLKVREFPGPIPFSLLTQDENVIFVYNALWDTFTNVFKYDVLLATVNTALWFRTIFMLELTQKYGPTLQILILMTNKIADFFVIWVLELIVFVCVGMLLFVEIEYFQNFDDAFFNIFFNAMGGFSPSDYESISMGERAGQAYLTIVLLVNLLLMLNFVIAILSDVYAKYAEQSSGLYLKGIIQARPYYEYDERYGFMITNPFPLNILNHLCLPFYYCKKKGGASDAELKKLNLLICKICYIPLAIMFVVIFTFVNIILIPFAYITALITKTIRLTDKNSNKTDSVINFILFLFVGPFMLTFSLLTDAISFAFQLFDDDVYLQETGKKKSMAIQVFDQITLAFKEEIRKETRKRKLANNNSSVTEITSMSLNKNVQNRLKIDKCFTEIVFGQKFSALNKRDSSEIQLDPIGRIQLFSEIKNVICSYANSKGMIQVQLMQFHLDEIKNKIFIETVRLLISLYDDGIVNFEESKNLLQKIYSERAKTNLITSEDYQNIVNTQIEYNRTKEEVQLAQVMIAASKPIQEFTNIKTNSILDAITDDQDVLRELQESQTQKLQESQSRILEEISSLRRDIKSLKKTSE